MKRPRLFSTNAVVLRSAEFGEADRLLTLYTAALGKVRALAKGVRKIRSRKAGHLEPFTETRVQLAEGRTFLIVTQAEAIHTHHTLRKDLHLLGLAAYIAELADRFIGEGEELPGFYVQISAALKRLETVPDKRLVVRYYEMRLLDAAGFRPELRQCVVCGAVIRPEPQFFSVQQGGVLCPKCGAASPEAVPVSVDALRYLRHFQRSGFAEAARARPSPATHAEMERLMQAFITHILERRLNSTRFIRRVKGLASKPPTKRG